MIQMLSASFGVICGTSGVEIVFFICNSIESSCSGLMNN